MSTPINLSPSNILFEHGPPPIDSFPDPLDSSADEYEEEDMYDDGDDPEAGEDQADPEVPNDSSGPPMAGDSSIEYPATQLIKELLPYIGSYEKFGRHVNLTRQLNTRSKATYKAINQLIAKFVTTQQSFEDTFRDFDTSSKAIPLLERILLDCYFADPAKVRRHTPDGDNVLEGIAFIETWFADRKLLGQALDKFKFEGLHVQELQEGHFTSIIADDKAALEAIVQFYQQYDGDGKVKDRDIYGRRNAKPVTELKNAISTLYREVIAKPGHGGFLEIVLKSLMLSAIPFHLLDERRVTDNPLKTDYKNHLKNYEVWKAMLSLANSITEVSKTGINDRNLATLKDKYEALRKLLLTLVKTEIDNLGDILSVIQLSAYIRRPFHARTVALIKALCYLDAESDKTNVGGRYELSEVLKSLFGTLTETRDAVKDVRTIIHLSDLYDSQAKKYQGLFDIAKQCSKDLKLSTATAWAKHEAAYQTAVALDKSNLDDAAKFLSISIKS